VQDYFRNKPEEHMLLKNIGVLTANETQKKCYLIRITD